MTPLQRIQLKNTVEKVLHAPCNASKDNLEWAFVFDYNVSKEQISSTSREIVTILKQHSPIFQNARLNVVDWKSDQKIEHKIAAMPLIQMGTLFKEYQTIQKEKRIEELMVQLKLYQARSKLIILLTDKTYLLQDIEKWNQSVNPFLCRRIILVSDNECKLLNDSSFF